MEELAAANDRTLSEQVEYYVDSGVFAEAKRMYEFSSDAVSPVLHRCISSRDVRKDDSHLDLIFSREYREMSTIAGKNRLNTAQKNELVPWVKEPGGQQHAVEMARSLINGIVRGALEGFEATLGVEVVAAIQADFHIGESQVNIKLKRAYQDLEMKYKVAESEIERLQFQLDRQRNMLAGPGIFAGKFKRVVSDLAADTAGLAPKHPRMPMPADLPSADSHGSGDQSIASLRDLLARFTDREPNLEALRAVGWPDRFGKLPAATRTALIGELCDGVADLYETLMSAAAPRGEAVTALRRLQNVLLPRGDDEGPHEDLGDVEKPRAKAQR
ncbi:hypothetical protein ACQKQD_24140 [Methylobacterium sp. NPDC080182]|uniref:hypothetical protein n=1 Tax=Methylobacterium sp. NPDC080182 TaxID=3390590 RepID=UPI003D0682B8